MICGTQCWLYPQVGGWGREFGVVSDRRFQVADIGALLLEEVTLATLPDAVYSRITERRESAHSWQCIQFNWQRAVLLGYKGRRSMYH
jgi:hypothetical protein